MSVEELQNTKALYERIKEVLGGVVNTFSSTTFNDEILSARNALSSYFLVDDEDLYSKEILTVQDGLNVDCESIKVIISNIDIKLEEINKKIIDAQIGNYM